MNGMGGNYWREGWIGRKRFIGRKERSIPGFQAGDVWEDQMMDTISLHLIAWDVYE